MAWFDFGCGSVFGFGCDLVAARLCVSISCRTPGEGSHPYICFDIEFDRNLVSASVVARSRFRLWLGFGLGCDLVSASVVTRFRLPL